MLTRFMKDNMHAWYCHGDETFAMNDAFPELIIFCSSLAKCEELYLHIAYPAAFFWSNIFKEHSFAMSLISSFLLLTSYSIARLFPFPFRLLEGNIKEFYFHKYSSLKNEPKESCFITTLYILLLWATRFHFAHNSLCLSTELFYTESWHINVLMRL